MNGFSREPMLLVSPRALWENFYVFVIYGVVVGLVTGAWLFFGKDLTLLKKLMTEPLSFYIFWVISAIGVLGLVATRTRKLRRNALLLLERHLLLPMANAGLSAGAVASGAVLGLALGFMIWAPFVAPLRQAVWTVLKLFMATGAPLVLLTVVAHGLFHKKIS